MPAFKSLIGRLTGGSARSTGYVPSICFGMCGKHPSEPDHFSEYPSPGCKRMPGLLSLLYTEGINRNIDSGAWEALPPEKRYETFDHVIVSQGADDLIVGRLWPSSDQVGRGRYPIIYAAETRGLSIAQLIDNVLPELERIEAKCRKAQMRSILKAELLAAAEKVGRLTSATSANSAMSLLDCDSLGPQRRGLYRILYRIMSEASVYLTEGAADPAMRSRSLVFPTIHLRVPACGSTQGEALARWGGLLSAIFSAGTPLMLIVPQALGWLDIVIGNPSGQHAFLLGYAGETLTSEIPYPLDADAMRRVDALLGAIQANASAAVAD